MTFYGYRQCTTCRKAKKYLEARGVRFDEIDITATPPSRSLLKSILQSGRYHLRDLFNQSGQLYRELNIKEKLTRLSEAQLLDLLASKGKLVKRPVITDGKKHTVGFKEAEFKAMWT